MWLANMEWGTKRLLPQIGLAVVITGGLEVEVAVQTKRYSRFSQPMS